MDFGPGTVDLSPGDGNVWVVCDPEDPDFGKSIDLRGISRVGRLSAGGSHKGHFSVVKRCPLNTVRSLLSGSVNCSQKLKGSDDVSEPETIAHHR